MRHIAAFILGLLALVQTLHADPTSVSGSLTATGQALTLAVANNNTWGLQVSGTWTGSLVVEGTINSTSWAQLSGFQLPSNLAATTITSSGLYFGAMPGMARVRVRAASLGSGSATTTLTLQDSLSNAPVNVSQAVSVAGSLTIGSSVLPDGASTSALQQAMTTQLSTLTAGLAGLTISSSALPSGASTSLLQQAITTQMGSLQASLAGLTISASALPSGASTASLQQAMTTQLNTIHTSLAGVTIAAMPAVTQGGAWTTAVNVLTSPLPVSPVAAGLFGGGSLAAGTNYIGAVNISNSAGAAVQVAGSITNSVAVVGEYADLVSPPVGYKPIIVAGKNDIGKVMTIALTGAGYFPAGYQTAGADGTSNANGMELFNDMTSGSSPLHTRPSLFNGTTWDRMRGTNGAQHVSITGGTIDAGIVRAVGLAVSVTAWPGARQAVSVTAWPADRQGVSITASVGLPVTISAAVGLAVTITASTGLAVSVVSQALATSLPAYTAAAPLPVSLTTISAAAPLPVTLPAITSANPLPAGVTINAVSGNLKTAGTGVDGLNTALAFDYDVNTKTANSRRGLDTTNSFFSTSGTTAVVASGYSLLYSITILPATIAGSKVTLFDGATTRVAVSAQTAQHYAWPRGVAFKTGMTSVVTGNTFDGGVSLEWAQ